MWVAGILSVSLCLFVFSGCGSGTDSPGTNPAGNEEVSGNGEQNPPSIPDFDGRQPVDGEDLPELVFYTINGCPSCRDVEEMVLRLRPDYLGELRIQIVNVSSEQGRRARKKYDFSHGFVLRSTGGDVMWKKSGHRISEHRLEQILAKHIDEEEKGKESESK